MKVIYKKYRCENCGSEDTVKLFENEKAPLCINCFNCHEGQQYKDQGTQSAARVGMFPVDV